MRVFWLDQASYYVINDEKNLCWAFIPGTAWSVNWLPENWEASFLLPSKSQGFSENLSCQEWNTAKCCSSQGYRYAWVPIGIEYISDERIGAELLAAKNTIETKSLNPHEYQLEDDISRKEIMKIIMKLSQVEISDSCREIFIDVTDDWGCKYIESALEYEYISGNQLFRPNDSVTKTEALKLIFKARNIDKAYNTEYWQEDYVSTAYYRGYIDEKYANYNETATRWWIFSVTGKTFPEFSKY